MAKIFDVDFRTGSMVDRVGGSIYLTPSGGACLMKGVKGLEAVIPTTSDYFSVSSTVNIGTIHTLIVEVNFKSKNGGSLFGAGNAGGTGISLYLTSSTTIRYNARGLTTGGVDVTFTIPKTDNNLHQLIFIRNGLTNVSLYYDGILCSASSSAYTTNDDFTIARIGNRTSGGIPLPCSILKIQAHNHLLTGAERAKAYSDFLNSHPLEIEKYPKHLDTKPNDLSYLKDSKLTDMVAIRPLTTWTSNGGATILSSSYRAIACAHTSSSGVIYPTEFLVGSKYKIRFYCESKDGDIGIWDGSSSGRIQVLVVGLGWNEITYTVSASPANHFLYVRGNNIYSFSISNVTVEKLEGLVAAYNMRPVGNQLIDISGSGKNLTINNTPSFKDGIIIKNDSTISSGGFVNSTVYTIHCVFKRNSSLGFFNILFLNLASSLNNSYYIDTISNLYFRHSAGNIFNIGAIPGTLNKTIISIVANGTTISLYVNGTLTGNITPNSTSFNFRYLYHDSYKWNREIYDLRVYDYALSESEVKNYHNSFAKRTYLQENFALEGADGVAKVPTGWSKQSGSFKVEEYVIRPTIYNYDFSAINGWSLDPMYSISGGVLNISKPSKAHGCGVNGILQAGKRYRMIFDVLSISGGGVTPAYLTAPAVTTTGRHILEFTPTSSYLGFSVNTTYAVTAVIDNLTCYEIPPLPTFKPGTKYLECVTYGLLAIPTKQAYGTWEFDFLYTGTPRFYFNCENPKGGYGIAKSNMIYLNLGVLGLYRSNPNSTLFTTPASYSLNTWYRIKITRSTSGVFTVYIKGGAFGNANWTLVSVSTGTNPVTDNTHTTSEYFVLDLDAGDRIANIKLTDGIEA